MESKKTKTSINSKVFYERGNHLHDKLSQDEKTSINGGKRECLETQAQYFRLCLFLLILK